MTPLLLLLCAWGCRLLYDLYDPDEPTLLSVAWGLACLCGALLLSLWSIAAVLSGLAALLQTPP